MTMSPQQTKEGCSQTTYCNVIVGSSNHSISRTDWGTRCWKVALYGLPFPRCRIQHSLLLNFMQFVITQPSDLPRSLCKALFLAHLFRPALQSPCVQQPLEKKKEREQGDTGEEVLCWVAHLGALRWAWSGSAEGANTRNTMRSAVGTASPALVRCTAPPPASPKGWSREHQDAIEAHR